VGAAIGAEQVGSGYGPDAHGVMVGGVPVGEDEYVREVMRRKADEIVSYIETTMSSLRDHPHSAWAALYYTCAQRLDHWLRHLPPYQTRLAAQRVDDAMRAGAEQLGWLGMLDDPIARERFGLAPRMHGCGVRPRVEVAPMAYTACCVEAMEAALDPVRPLFAALEPLFGAGAFAVGGHRFRRFLRRTSGTAHEFGSTWDALRAEVQAAASAPTGPLDLDAEEAGRMRGEDRLQRALTLQVEQLRRDELHRRIRALDASDRRRVAWMAMGRGSRQWVTSHPDHRVDLDGHGGLDFRIQFATYLGVECPVSRDLAAQGLTIAGTSGRPDTPVDRHGIRISVATDLPGGSHTVVHDAILREVGDICGEAGLDTHRECAGVFARAIPAAVLALPRGQGRPDIIPDARIGAALPPPLTHAAQRPSSTRQPLRRHLCDVKTVFGGSLYLQPRARDRQSGAVEERAQQVHPAYIRHARVLDRRLHPAGSPTHRYPHGPVEQVILDHGHVRGLVFGAYGEWSSDVEHLLEEAAHSAARRGWRSMGCASEAVAYGLIVASYRRRLGIVVVREFARHRYRQSQLVGLTREQLTAIARDAQRQRAGATRGEELAALVVELAQQRVVPAAERHGG